MDDPDSDDNGVRDGIEFRLSGGKPCKNSQCQVRGADPYVQCSGLNTTNNGQVIYGDRDKDYLNDCEEHLLGSDVTSFDSNDDYIPDHLAVLTGVGFIKGSNEALLDPDFDAIDNYFELKKNTPTRADNERIPELKELTYKAEKTSADNLQSCYEVKITNMVTLTPKDRIRVYLLENRSAIGTKKILRVAEVDVVDKEFKINDLDFQ